jgi:type IV pilus assembly protein PilV
MPAHKNCYLAVLFNAFSFINKKLYHLLSPQFSKACLCMAYLKPMRVSNHLFAFSATHFPSKKNSLANKQTGFSMIELLVAMLVFSIGLLGMASLQVTGMRMTRDAELMGRASLYVSSMADRIRANPSALVDTADWNQAIKTTLPQGSGKVTTVNRSHTISVAWLESQDGALKNSSRSYELMIQL